MTASWMIYAIVVGALLSAGAHLAERSFRLAGRPVRFLWAAVMFLSILLPLVSPRLPWQLSIDLPIAAGGAETVLPSDPAARELAAAEAARSASGEAATAPASVVTLEGALPVLWGAASGTLALLLLYAVGVLHGRRREWRKEQLDGIEVLVSQDVGPAVIGWRRIDIVVPEWVRELEPSALALVLRHELEHVTRKDPRHVLRGYLALIVMPWNPALWWQLRRLRRAIELDCDARVVASGVHWSEYGRALLDVVGRCRRIGLPAFAAFAERRSDLEARIHALGSDRPRTWKRQAVVAGAAAVACVAAACMTPDATAPEMGAGARQPATGEVLVRVRESGAGKDVAIMYRDPDGTVLGAQMMPARTAGDRRTLDRSFLEIPTAAIESVEVIKGKATGLESLDGMIIITVKRAAVPQLREMLRRHQETSQQLQKVLEGLVMSGEQPVTAAPGKVYLWYEIDASGTMRRAGRVTTEAELLRRNGQTPVENGLTGFDYGKLEVVRWARYDVH